MEFYLGPNRKVKVNTFQLPRVYLYIVVKFTDFTENRHFALTAAQFDMLGYLAPQIKAEAQRLTAVSDMASRNFDRLRRHLVSAGPVLCKQASRSRLKDPNYLLFVTRSFHNILRVQSSFFDYEHERKTFNLRVPQRFNFVRDVFDLWSNAEQSGKRESNLPALWWTDDRGRESKYSFKQLEDISCRLANVFTGPCKLRERDRLIVILPRIPEWWMINLACIRAGIATSPGTVQLRTKDILHRLLSSKAKCIIADEHTVDFIDEVYQDCPDLVCRVFVGKSRETRQGWLNFYDLLDRSSSGFKTADTAATDPMMLFFTSGTTGGPKMTEHSQASCGLGHLITARYGLQAGPQDVVWNMSDTGWAKCAWSSLFAPWLHGACIFVQHTSRFDPQEVLKVLSNYPITHLCTPPTATRLMVKERLTDYKLICLRHTICGGEPVNPELMEAWLMGTGQEIFEVYGQTETTLLCARYPCIDYRPGSMGKAAPGVDLQVVDDSGLLSEPGKEGNLVVRCQPYRPVGLFTRYVDDPERMKSSFRGGFYWTGDRAYYDEDNYIYFVGRDDDVINSAGYRIGPFEVESALIEHPAVLESAVVSSPDEARGEIVKAFVILTQDYKNSDLERLTLELQEYVKTVTAPYKYPRKIEFVEDLPRTISGKIRRVELRNREWKKIMK